MLRYLHSIGADWTLENSQKRTPLAVAQHIGEDDAALVIETLLAGKNADHIGLGKDMDLSDDDEVVDEPPPPSTRSDVSTKPTASDAKPNAELLAEVEIS